MAKFRFQDLEIWQMAIEIEKRDDLLEKLDHLCRRIMNFKKTLNK